MKKHPFLSHICQPARLGVLALVLTGLTLNAAESALYKVDPAKVLGAENCAECHASMVEAWKASHHFSTFNETHRTPQAKEIQDKIGIRSMKRDDVCIKCHYTNQGDSRIRAISGVSCESCHNAGADWNTVHSVKEDPDALAKAEKLGMLRPHNYYEVAANCFACHTVPDEKLVNVGGHKAGSDFELVSWLQGEVRHNMQKSAGKENVEPTAERKRLLYVAGRVLDLEYGLRGMAQATAEGTYAKSMTDRVNTAKGHVKKIADAAGAAELKQIMETADAAELKPGNKAALTTAADKVSQLAKQFCASQDGSKLAALDSLLPPASQYKGKVYTP